MADSHSAEQSPIKELMEYIVKSLVDDPDSVQLNEVNGTESNVLELRVAKEDGGKVIGRHGRTAKALRTILRCATVKYKKKKYWLDILNDGGDKQQHPDDDAE